MGRVWVLDTETKGTGAEMVPLDKVQQKSRAHAEPLFVPPKRKPRELAPAEPRAPRAFKVVDVATRTALAEGVRARETLEVLAGVRSIVDVHVFVREPGRDGWRLLTMREQRLLWDRR